MKRVKIYLLTILWLTLATLANAQTISGTSTVCAGSSVALSGSPLGGTWSSSNVTVGTVSTSGVVFGISAGTATITYDIGTGYTTRVVTVNPTPVITGPMTFCAGTTTTLSSGMPGGVWSISAGIAYFPSSSSGALTGISAGIAPITYVSAAGCQDTAVVQVIAGPAAIGGPSSVCLGNTVPYTDATPGGTWSSSNTSIATIGSSSGVLSTVSAGALTISYTLSSGCYMTKIVTVNPAPTYSGSPAVCVGTSTTLVGGCGTWTGGGTAATVDTYGVVSGLSAGMAAVTFTACTGCYTTVFATVNPTATISGTTALCLGSTSTLSASVSGGTWMSSNPVVAAVGSSTGAVSALSIGTATISYVTSSGCVSTVVVTVTPAASAGTISGSLSVCAGNTTALSSTVSGGTWTSSTTSVATVTSAGMVTGVSAGTSTITYTVSGGCGTASTTAVVTVNASAAITGTSPVCVGFTSTLSSTASCGTWSSSNPTVATVAGSTPSSAVVTGVSAGSAVISLSLCSGCVVTYTVYIASSPAPITGSHSVCVGSSLALDDTTSGGAWSSSNPSVATIATIGLTPGVVTGVGAGVVIMTYSMGPGCSTTFTMTVNPLPAITASASTSGCGGSYLATATGGTYYSWAPSTGVSCPTCAVTNITGASTIYTVTGTNSYGCSASDTVNVGGNRIFGRISFSGAMPSVTTCRVWLTHFNPLDSSIIAVDSTTTCVDSTQPYYQFNSVAPGSYMVKAKLLSSVPGTSDYYPVYGYSSPYWTGASVISHGAAVDSQDINMVSGTVLSGPGFIGGYVYEGAGKGTSSMAPVSGMLVFLKNAVTDVILNYTYTSASGYYGFNNLPYGAYIVYPEEYDYYTTPSSTIMITTSATSFAMTNFKKHTSYSTITPYDSLVGPIIVGQIKTGAFRMYPNPSGGTVHIELNDAGANKLSIVITDLAGRAVYSHHEDNFSNQNKLDIDVARLDNGLYFVTTMVDGTTYTEKLVVQRQ